MVKRLGLLFVLGAVLAAVAAVACTKEVVKEVIVEKPIIVEREVIKEVPVEKIVVVEKEVIKEVPVEKIVIIEKEVVKIVEVEKPVIVEKEVRVVTEVTTAEKVARLRFCCAVNLFTPHLTGSGSPDGLFNLIGNFLVRSDPIKRKDVPDLAERWEIAPDFTSATYYLRKNAVWQDGAPMTAHDVAFTYKLWLDPTSIFANLFYGLKGGKAFSEDFDNFKTNKLPGVIVVDDHTIRFEYTGPQKAFVESRSRQTRWTVLPKHIMGEFSAEETRTSSWYQDTLTQGGAFKLLRHVPQQFIELEPNDLYYFGAPILDKIILINIPDRDAAEVAAHRGEVDMMYRGGLSGVDAYAGLLLNPLWKMASMIGSGDIAYSFSKAVDPALKDKRFRQAFAFALDRQAILDGVLKGRGAITSMTVASHQYARPEWRSMYDYDPVKAKALLADMGWDSSREVEVIVTNPDVLANAMMPIEQNMLADVGIKIKFNVMERASHVDAMKKFDYEMQRGCGIIPGGSGHPGNTFRMEWHSDGRDLTGFAADQGPSWDAKIEALVAAISEEEIIRIFREIGDIMMDELPCIGILHKANYYPIAKRLRVPAYEAIGVYDSTASQLKDVPRYVPYWRQYDHQMFAPERWDIQED